MTSWNPVAFVRNAARNSPWIVMAVALHLILLAVATVFYATQSNPLVEVPPIVLTPYKAPIVDEIVEPPLPERTAIPETREAELTDIPVNWALTETSPAPADDAGEPESTFEFDSPRTGGGTAVGVGSKGATGGGPGIFWGRPGRPGGPKKGPPGGEAEVREAAVLAGLRWLARHQNEDGGWGAASLNGRCDPDHACGDTHANYLASYDEGLTGLALLGFLGSGFTHQSKEYLFDSARDKKKVQVGTVVKQGLQWLVAHQNADGSFGKDRPFTYNQALATMALCEAYGLTQNRAWRGPAQRAVDYLAGAQRPSPMGTGLWGWRYASRQEIERFHQGDSLDEQFRKEIYDADTSVTGWAVMALKSARMSGLDVKQENLDGALAYAKWASTADGQAGYLDPKGAGAKVTGPDDQFDYHATGMSALSMCIRTFTAHDAEDPFLEAAAKRIAADVPRVSKDKLSIDYYYWYYGSLALFQFDGPDSPRGNGKYWKTWNKAMVDSILDLQQKGGKDCGEGGWLVPDRWCHSGGPIYATAINVLTLEVYYRYENAFSAGRTRTDKRGAPIPPIEGAK